MSRDAILHEVYLKIHEIYTNGSRCWLNAVTQSLQAAGYNQDIDTLTISVLNDSKSFLKNVKLRLHNNYILSWSNLVNESRMLRTYKLFKRNFSPEGYLFNVKNKKLQKYISRFRLSSHNLGVQLGRHQGVNPDQRKCLYCNADCIDDELHFLVQCPYHDNERNLLLNEISPNTNIRNIDNSDSFLHIMQSDNVNVMYALGKFIETGFKRRADDPKT